MSCEICKKTFNILWRRETKCKRCQAIICTDCSKLQQVREVFRTICKVCMKDCEYMKKIITDDLLAWNHTSEYCKKYWIKDVEFIKQMYKLNTQVKTQSIIRDVKTALESPWNYSISEFLQLLKPNTKDVESTIINVVDTFHSRNQKVGYNQNLIKVAIFLLCFCKDYICVKILEDLYNKIPKQYYPSYQTTQEFIKDHDSMQHDAIQDLKFRFQLEQQEIITAKSFIESAMLNYKNQFYLNLTFSSSLYLLDKLIQSQDNADIDKYFSVIIKINIHKLSINSSELSIARNTTLESIKQYQQHISKKRSSLYLQVDKQYNDIQNQSFRTARRVDMSEFEADEGENLSNSSPPSKLQAQKIEISKLTQELLSLEQQINQLKQENQLLEEQSTQNTALLFKDYENIVNELIDQTETLLKFSMSN